MTFLSERRLLCRQQTKVFFITLQFRTLAWSQRYVSAQHVRSTLTQAVDKFSVALSSLLLLICQLICTFQNGKILFLSADSCCNDVVCRARRLLLRTCQTPILDTMTTNTKIITSTKYQYVVRIRRWCRTRTVTNSRQTRVRHNAKRVND